MLTVQRGSGELADRTFRDFPSLLLPGDLLVLNNSRVIPARLFARRAGLRTQSTSPAPSGRIEVLLTRQLNATDWLALVKPGRKVQAGEVLAFGEQTNGSNTCPPGLTCEVLDAADFGERTLRFAPTADFFDSLEQLGHIPLPPYLHRLDTAEDRERYQTVYAGTAAHGSAAAPTAGLHFTTEILRDIESRGVEVCYVTLHVGLGTFQPVRVDDLQDIHLHAESYTLPHSTATALNAAKLDGRRIVAAGTTTVRTLESCAQAVGDAPLEAHSGQTSIFLSPGYRFRMVDALLTNFHLPQSTLLMLVCAFAGTEHVLAAYHHAVSQRYRFFSYGDCMFLS